MSKTNIILTIVIVLLSMSTLFFFHKTKTLNTQIDVANNNGQAWMNIANDRIEQNRVLQLTIDEFKGANDSLLQLTSKQQDELNIKDKQLRQVETVETVIRDTLTTIVPVENTDFNVELTPNKLTYVSISRKDSVLTHIMEIKNHQDLFIYEEKQYRRKYKNWFQRLIHFDFKKNTHHSYQIVNSNDLIQILDTRVVELSK